MDLLCKQCLALIVGKDDADLEDWLDALVDELYEETSEEDATDQANSCGQESNSSNCDTST